jgi:hypothetical protein
MSFRGLILISLLLVLISSGAFAQEDEGIGLNFSFIISDDTIVSRSVAMEKNPSAFVDTNGDGLFDQVTFGGAVINSTMDQSAAIGFTFDDGAKMVFYPTLLGRLPAAGTYEIIGFLHRWQDNDNQLVAILAYQSEGYETSDGISIYIIDRAGVRVGSLFHAFLDKAFLRYTAPYQKWMETGQDFGVATSPVSSRYALVAKDLGLMDTVLIVNMSLVETSLPPQQDLKIRANEPAVIQESRSKMGVWDSFILPANSSGAVPVSVKVDGKTISSKVYVDRAQGFAYRDNRYVVFYPNDITRLPTARDEGVNWELLGLLHYFDDEGKVNSLIGVLLGQAEGEETTLGARIRYIDNTGTDIGKPKFEFKPRRSIRIMGTFSRWSEAEDKEVWAAGHRDGQDRVFFLVWDLGITDKMLVTEFQWY